MPQHHGKQGTSDNIDTVYTGGSFPTQRPQYELNSRQEHNFLDIEELWKSALERFDIQDQSDSVDGQACPQTQDEIAVHEASHSNLPVLPVTGAEVDITEKKTDTSADEIEVQMSSEQAPTYPTPQSILFETVNAILTVDDRAPAPHPIETTFPHLTQTCSPEKAIKESKVWPKPSVSQRAERNEKINRVYINSSNSWRRINAYQSRRECPSWWYLLSTCLTFWALDPVLRCFGVRSQMEQRAWREKIALIIIIILLCGCVGFLSFGLQPVMCKEPLARIRITDLGESYFIAQGHAYGFDDLITQPVETQLSTIADTVSRSIMETCAGDAATSQTALEYIGCAVAKLSIYRNGAQDLPDKNPCHATGNSRPLSEYKLLGEVYYEWEDILKSDRNLVIYNGAVLDFSRLQRLLPNISVNPDLAEFTAHASNFAGRDATLFLWRSQWWRESNNCMSSIVRIGVLANRSVGCMLSDFIIWVLAQRLVNIRKSPGRERDIEMWENSTFNLPMDTRSNASPNLERSQSSFEKHVQRRRSSLLPRRSRYSTPGKIYEPIRPYNSLRRPPMLSTADSPPAASLSALSVFSTTDHILSRRSSTITTATRPRNAYSLDYTMNLPSPPFSPDNVLLGSPRPGLSVDELTSIQLFSSEAARCSTISNLNFRPMYTICLVTCYSEGREGLRATFDSLAATDYQQKLLVVIADGIITGSGNNEPTPDIVLGMMQDLVVSPDLVEPCSYVAVSDGTRRHNRAKVFAGYYIKEGGGSKVPMILIAKCGTADEQSDNKPGNRGKRDSQIILMNFLQKVMFDDRMTALEYELFNAFVAVGGVTPDQYEAVLMVDADTKVYPDSLTHMVACMSRNPRVMGLCGETRIANKMDSWVTMIQVFEYYISHHLNKAFESVFGGVTCLPGCFCMYRVKAPKGEGQWVPLLANPDIIVSYSENAVDTLHKKNLLLLGEDRFLTTLMLRTFPRRKMIFVPQSVCKTVVPNTFRVLLSQRRRWINSTVHNLLELVMVRDLCGTFCFSMQFVVLLELIGTVVLPAAICFTFYLIVASAFTYPPPVIPLLLLGAILGLPAVLIVMSSRKLMYVAWMFIYLLSLPVWNFILPVYAFWHFDDFSWGQTRMVSENEKIVRDVRRDSRTSCEDPSEPVDHREKAETVVMKRWCEWERVSRPQFVIPPRRTLVNKESSASNSSKSSTSKSASFHKMDL
ncbi:uncharacterized protein VTP21DRAFT_8647 [Calcarisporiella thermophila]|uniref:uncharacterized protein n=1 Tax=Calcarisporiella thermophila TaxID=911321 RepID=UPI003743EC06